jgi:23S rRNA (adenine2503-C2)-methyltransferase
MINYRVPTGNILVVDGEKGKIECLSLGDYGRTKNVKATFLGLHDDIAGVPNGDTMPLSEKWVITISTQYGCSMGCVFCDVPKVGPGRNATLNDLTSQVLAAIKLHPEVKRTKRLNVHYARMGEPTFNFSVLSHAARLEKEIMPFVGMSHVHPVVSTMLPRRNKNLLKFLQDWCWLKNHLYQGSAGLQFSINSTNDTQREFLFNGNSLCLSAISEIGAMLPKPRGRKYALNVALADGNEIDADKMAFLFSPNKFMVKITPIHVTTATESNGVKTTGGYTDFAPYQEIEEQLKIAGFDVLVFVPSFDEDNGRITCGNAILSGTLPLCKYEVVQP